MLRLAARLYFNQRLLLRVLAGFAFGVELGAAFPVRCFAHFLFDQHARFRLNFGLLPGAELRFHLGLDTRTICGLLTRARLQTLAILRLKLFTCFGFRFCGATRVFFGL